ncbi:MAG: Rieske 2Fe-2S domain-containing protein, partial [Chloroflexota bacterium]
ELMRRYWQPIAGLSELNDNPTKAIRLLGEDLVLYKDESGTLGLIDASCAHRRVNLLFGIPEKHGLRCSYHGWLFDETGQCTETPAEPADSTFASKVRIKSYPVQSLGGLVFAYLGPAPAPLLPHYYPFVEEGRVRSIGWTVVTCNWLQIMENSLDPIHAEYLHGYFSKYVLQRLGVIKHRGDIYGKRPVEENPDVTYWRKAGRTMRHVSAACSRFEYGILKHRLLEGETPEDSIGWRHGHPVVFPNLESGTGGHDYQIRVPIDDNNTYYVYYSADLPREGEPVDQAENEIPVYHVPIAGVDQRGQPVWGQLDNNSGQDHFAWTSQGPRTKRHLEKLGQSDIGILLYRRMLTEQMELVEAGGEPMNVFRDPAKNDIIWLPYDRMDDEVIEGRRSIPKKASHRHEAAISAGSSGKFNPFNLAEASRRGLPLPPPFPESDRTVVEVSPG